MMDELVRMYEKGAITSEHLVIESLHRIDPAEPGLVLSVLPGEVLDRMLLYAAHYRPGAMRTNYGLQASADQVAAAKSLTVHRCLPTSASGSRSVGTN